MKAVTQDIGIHREGVFEACFSFLGTHRLMLNDRKFVLLLKLSFIQRHFLCVFSESLSVENIRTSRACLYLVFRQTWICFFSFKGCYWILFFPRFRWLVGQKTLSKILYCECQVCYTVLWGFVCFVFFIIILEIFYFSK